MKDFQEWWGNTGMWIDPDVEIPWVDKRKGLAEIAYEAGRVSGSAILGTIEVCICKHCVSSINEDHS